MFGRAEWPRAGRALQALGLWGCCSRAGGAVLPLGGWFVCPPPSSSPLLLCSVTEGINKEVLGILVSYRVKVKLVVSRGG